MSKPCITIDVEDWQQSTWDRSSPVSPLTADNTLKLLELLDDLSIKTTMFIQGKFAKVFQDIVKRINKCGHEVASHGYPHIEIFNQNKIEFKDDVEYCKNTLEDIISKRIIGYRAPDFSIIKESLWALETLTELGFEHDSSIFPIKHSRFGISNFSSQPIRLLLNNGCCITEYPIATFKILNKNLPIGGGGYHRLLPGYAFRQIAKPVIRRGPFIFYCHPYEFNPDEFTNMKTDIPFLTKLHQGLGRSYFKERFRKFVMEFGFQKISELHSNFQWEEEEINNLLIN